ncbi:MAG: SOS response-associated peptidase [Pseudomonadota bacterium]
MCYDVKVLLESQLKKARHEGDQATIDEIIEKLVPYTDLPIHHASGFNHPDVLIYTEEDPNFPTVATWGLIPHWVKSEEQKNKLWNSTLNARGETIFEKPSFKNSAQQKRCVVYVDGFYEHHHYNGQVYPFYISLKSKKPMVLAGLYDEWQKSVESPSIWKSFTIVTQKGNGIMRKIHNSPKLKEPRIPLILDEEQEKTWLKPIKTEDDLAAIEQLIAAENTMELSYHTVSKLRGKEYLGNVEQISSLHTYAELVF